MNYYAVTLSPFNRDVTFKTLLKVFDELLIKGKAQNHLKVCEISNHGKPHIHALLSMRANVYIKRLLTRGYSTDIKSLKTEADKLRWERYIYKLVHPQYRCKEGLEIHNSSLAFVPMTLSCRKRGGGEER